MTKFTTKDLRNHLRAHINETLEFKLAHNGDWEGMSAEQIKLRHDNEGYHQEAVEAAAPDYYSCYFDLLDEEYNTFSQPIDYDRVPERPTIIDIMRAAVEEWLYENIESVFDDLLSDWGIV